MILIIVICFALGMYAKLKFSFSARRLRAEPFSSHSQSILDPSSRVTFNGMGFSLVFYVNCFLLIGKEYAPPTITFFRRSEFDVIVLERKNLLARCTKVRHKEIRIACAFRLAGF